MHSLARIFLFLIFLLHTNFSNAQKRDYVWCFGDSAGLDFNASPPTTFLSGFSTSEGVSSISANQGNLLFYYGDSVQAGYTLAIKNINHGIMQNGDSILGNTSCTSGPIILPYPSDTAKYILFHLNYPPIQLYYSIVMFDSVNQLGHVTQKNILLVTNDTLTEKIAAVKHANGRDWWLVEHSYSSDKFIKFLVTPAGISGPFNQNIGSVFGYDDSVGEITFSRNGDKLVYATYGGKIDLYDFDRCSGILSNWKKVGPIVPLANDVFYGCEISASGKYLYVTSIITGSCRLFQYDLTSTYIPSSKTLVYTNNRDSVMFGQLQLAPDNKIYMANAFDPGFPFNTTYDSLNMYIGVINNPDSAGLQCNFAPYSVYLGGHRSFFGLPNMLNYNLGSLTGSPCDTLTGVNTLNTNTTQLNLCPNPATNHVNITYQFKTNEQALFTLYNSMGQEVVRKTLYGAFKSLLLHTNTYHAGMYYYKVVMKNKMLQTGKLVIGR